MRGLAMVVAAVGVLATADVQAHGIWGHVHVTGWAVENMPDDELRSFLLDDPEVFNALLFGAVFTDTGYARNVAASRAYSEHAHWEPFVEDYVAWIRANDPPPWTSLESKKRVAFLLGVASHGLQDSIFDSLFLHQVEERDGAGQGETDPGTDGFLVLDGHIRFIPEEYVPMSTVLALYEPLSEDITEEVIDTSVQVVTLAYINDGLGLQAAEFLGDVYAESMPWGREHYMDPAVPGSLRSEIFPTMAYQQAIWSRLHGTLAADHPVIYTYPTMLRQLRSADSTTVDSWVTLVFGAGVHYQEDLATLLDHTDEVVPFSQANTRWGAGDTRLIRLQPTEDLLEGQWYTAQMRPGASLINGSTTTTRYRLPFQAPCSSAGDPRCFTLGAAPVARIDGELDAPDDVVDAESPGSCSTTTGRSGYGWVAILCSGLGAWRRKRAGLSHPRASRGDTL